MPSRNCVDEPVGPKAEDMLRCRQISKRFGGIHALMGVDLSVEPGEIVGLIGPNGSGKSTLINVISGFLRPDEGAIEFRDRRIKRAEPSRMRIAGVGRTFQNLRLLPDMTALDNLLLGLHLHYTSRHHHYWNWASAAIGTKSSRLRDESAHSIAEQALDNVGLLQRANVTARSLSYGEQKRLEFARASLLSPSLLLLDEPTAGL